MLESGEVPQDNITKNQDPFINKAKRENSDSFFLTQKQNKNLKKINLHTNNKSNKTASLIKNNNTVQNFTQYTYKTLNNDKAIPKKVLKSLYILDMVCIKNFTIQDLKEKYHQLLKSNHPDTKDKYSKINYTIKDIKQAYETVKKYMEGVL